MRKSLLLIAFITNIIAFAGERSDKEMQAIAVSQLSTIYPRTRGVDNNNLNVVKVLSAEEYSIFAPEDGHGFVVVSSDDAYKPVLGYSNSEFNSENLPDGFRWWLSAISSSLKEGKTISNKTRANDFVPVGNFVLSTWGQNKPYNALTPQQGVKQSVTGCVATSMAQVLNYYKYPETSEGVGAYSIDGFSTTNVDIATTYMWDKIQNKYNTNASYSEEDSRPVAELMRDCGASAHMDYSASSSAAYTNEAALGLLRNFKFHDTSICLLHHKYYSQEEWLDIIYNELMVKRPIIYGGSNDNSGHSFIFTGLDDEGRVYINWGWDGTANGFYDISDLRPENDKSMHFNYGQEMVIGITPYPEDTDIKPKYSEICFEKDYQLSAPAVKNRISVRTGVFYNMHYKMFKGVIDLLFVNEAGEQYAFNFLKEEEGEPFRYGYSSKNKFITISDLPAGDYKVYLASKAEKDTYYQPVKCAGVGAIYYNVTKGEDEMLVVSGEYQSLYGGTTAIKSVIQTENETGVNKSSRYVYSLNGQNMGTDASALPKGVYIINGKKVVK